MNMLDPNKRALILRCLMNGNTIRGTAAQCEVSKRTIPNLIFKLGKACEMYTFRTFKDLRCCRIRIDDATSYIESGHGEGEGFLPIYTAVCVDTRLVIAWSDSLEDLSRILSERISENVTELQVGGVLAHEVTSYLSKKRKILPLGSDKLGYHYYISTIGAIGKSRDNDLTIERRMAMASLYSTYYNFVRKISQSTPAVMSCMADDEWSMTDLAMLEFE